VRLGSLHRNTFVNSPRLLLPTLQLRSQPQTFLAGQLIGVEGYVESAAAGILAAINATRLSQGVACVVPPATTALGALVHYVTDARRREFQPMNANYGLFPAISGGERGRDKRKRQARRAWIHFGNWIAEQGIEDGLAPSAAATAMPASLAADLGT